MTHIAQEQLLPRALLGSANANNKPHSCCRPILTILINNNANIRELMHWLAPRRVHQRSAEATAEIDDWRLLPQKINGVLKLSPEHLQDTARL